MGVRLHRDEIKSYGRLLSVWKFQTLRDKSCSQLVESQGYLVHDFCGIFALKTFTYKRYFVTSLGCSR